MRLVGLCVGWVWVVFTWQEGDDGVVSVGPLVEVHHDLGAALSRVAAHGGFVADVAAAVHQRRDVPVLLVAHVHGFTELDLWH